MRGFMNAVWKICKKDLRVWLSMRVLIAATFLVPLSYLLVEYLGAAAVGRNPVAIVNLDHGPIGAKIVQSIINADVFRVRIAGSEQAATLYRQLDVAAIITIPPDFSRHVQAHERAPIQIEVNNLNLDLTNDIRRAVPDAITRYYETQGRKSPISVRITEQLLRPQDIALFQYAVLPTILLLITTSGVITSGLAATLEWEKRTMKELLLSPIGHGPVIVGKTLAGFITTTILGVAMLVVGAALGWTRPAGLYWLSTLLIIALGSLFSSGLGIAIGAFFQRQQPVIFCSTVVAVYLFALAGGVGVIFFEPEWLQVIAAYDPLTYAIHALQMAVFYHSSDQLLRDVVVLAGTAAGAISLGSLTMRREIMP
jgi:ABC-2 type transport system permease protein